MTRTVDRIAGAIFAASLGLSGPLAAPAAAQGYVNPSAPAVPGSAQRRAILDALRPAVEARLGPDVEFVVHEIRVVRGWAYVLATPQRRGGRPIDGRRYFPDFAEMDSLDTTAVLRFQNRRWNLVDHRIGAGDVWYCDMGPPGFTPRCTVD